MIRTEAAAYRTREKLSELLQRTPNRFVQCHKSYAVNMQWIRRMTPDSLILRNGAQIPVSRSRSTRTREQVFAFMGLQL